MRIAILDDYAGIALRSADWSDVARRAEITVFREALTPEDALAALQPFDVLCTVRERSILPDALLAHLPRLKLITVIGDRLTSIDVAAASARGIQVCSARGSTEDRGVTRNAAPELAWGLVLATARHIPQQDQALRASGGRPGPAWFSVAKRWVSWGLASSAAASRTMRLPSAWR